MTDTTAPLSENYLYRFGGIARLYGRDGLEALHRAHFVVVGLGGVGTKTINILKHHVLSLHILSP